MENWTNPKLCDVANLILGAILFVSLWMFGFDAGTVSTNAYITGIAIACDRGAGVIRGVGGVAQPRRRFVGAGFALGIGLPRNHRDDGACGYRCGGRDPGCDRALDDVPDPAAADHRPLRAEVV